MSTTTDYLAIDLGAESGRGLLGRFDGDKLTLDELHRFPNGPTRFYDTLHWDVLRLAEEIKASIKKADAASPGLDGLGIDTWGVDFGLLGKHDTLLGNPVHYRDARTDGMMDAALARVPRERIYEITGLQFLPFNTIYQLLAMRLQGSPILDAAETFLMMPDLLGWLLTGRKACERTDSSTTQLLDPRTGAWSDELCSKLDIPRAIFPEIVEPGSVLGTLRRPLMDELGLSRALTVIAPGTHDTASAVAAVPAASTADGGPPDWCYLSSGTWSLLGAEVPAPIINAETSRYNFTNEGGVFGTTRLLKNIMGLWLVQECRRTWAKKGKEFSYDELIAMAKGAPAFRSLVDADDPSFLAPGDMPARIAAACRASGQPEPASEGAHVRCALESLALKYRWVIERIEAILGTQIKTIHIVGGGSKNALLNQFTADCTGRPVVAGPVEATAIGNILLQALAQGKIATLRDARAIVARSFGVTLFDPNRQAKADWDAAAARLMQK